MRSRCSFGNGVNLDLDIMIASLPPTTDTPPVPQEL